MKWVKNLFKSKPDLLDVFKGRKVYDISDDELYDLIDTRKLNYMYRSQFTIIVAELLRRQRR